MRRLRSPLVTFYRSIVGPVARQAGRFLGLVPSLLAGAGVFLVVAGLFYYLEPAAAEPLATPTAATASGSPDSYSLPPPRSATPSGSAAVNAAIATRVVIPRLGIDLPVVASPPNEQFPLCNAAEYMVLGTALAYPGLPQATYLYAHARTNMFLPAADPIEDQQRRGDDRDVGRGLHGRQPAPRLRDLPRSSGTCPIPSHRWTGRLGAKTDQLWLQTSEGPLETSMKLRSWRRRLGRWPPQRPMPIPPRRATSVPTHPGARRAMPAAAGGSGPGSPRPA